MARSQTPSLLILPNELLESIVAFLPLESAFALQSTCKRFQGIVDTPATWRTHCAAYHYWEGEHNIKRRTLRSNAPTAHSTKEWKKLLRGRRQVDRTVRRNLDGIIASQHKHIPKILEIIEHGVDAKDELLRQCAAPDDADDVLARRYYAEKIIEIIHRQVALREWGRLRAEPGSVPLERALGAFDMFVACGRHADLDSYTEQLDDIADGVRRESEDFDHLTLRQKALVIVRALRQRGFRGVTDEDYDNMENNFIGYALSPRHEALPLITVAIFCAVATRLGVSASPLLYPFHIYAVVRAPAGETLDGHLPGAGGTPRGLEETTMYIDPFRSEEEISDGRLRRGFELHARSEEYDFSVRVGSTTEITLRSARNVFNSYRNLHRRGISSSVDMINALSGHYWAHIILALPINVRSASAAGISAHLQSVKPFILYELGKLGAFAVPLHERYALPPYDMHRDYEDIARVIRSIRLCDNTPKQAIRRTPHMSETVKYKVGQLFRHKRYGYEGVITGWDSACKQDEDWIRQMGVDGLNGGGRDQSFYHVLVSDKSQRYVAQVNIEVETKEPPSENMMKLAGEYFKRWDSESHVFISNVREQYPDD